LPSLPSHTNARGVNLDTLGGWLRQASRRSISTMENTLRHITASEYTQKRIAQATAARHAKELRKAKPPRRSVLFFRRRPAPALTPQPR
jgi:hypothetical protein